jgi:hypothetical protein
LQLRKPVGKIISWVLLTLAVFTLVLVVWPPSGAKQAADPEAARAFDRKLAELETAHQQGRTAEVRLSGIEVNSKLQQIFGDMPRAGLMGMRGVTVELVQDHLLAFFSVKVMGPSLYITLGGKPGIEDHRLQFNLDEVRLGHMPTSSSLISEVLAQKLNSPEGREMLLMPDYMTGMRVENGELVIESK